MDAARSYWQATLRNFMDAPALPTLAVAAEESADAQDHTTQKIVLDAAVEKSYGSKRKITCKKYWPEKRHSIKPASCCPKQHSTLLKNTKLPSRVH